MSNFAISTKKLLSVLEEHVPKKQTYVPANNSNFVDKNLEKAIMT